MEKPLVSFHGSCLARFFEHVTNALESFRMLFKIKSLERSNLLINLIPFWWWPKISLFCDSYVYANVPTRIFLTNIIIIYLLNWDVVKEKCEKWKKIQSYYIDEEINMIYDDVWAILCYGKALIVWIFLILMRNSFIKLYFIRKKLSYIIK